MPKDTSGLKPVRTTEEAAKLGAKGGKAKKGSKHISTHIREMLNDEEFEAKLESGEIIKGRPIKAIIKAAILKAADGDVRAFDTLAKRGWGDQIDITSGGDKIQVASVIDMGNVEDNTETE